MRAIASTASTASQNCSNQTTANKTLKVRSSGYSFFSNEKFCNTKIRSDAFHPRIREFLSTHRQKNSLFTLVYLLKFTNNRKNVNKLKKSNYWFEQISKTWEFSVANDPNFDRKQFTAVLVNPSKINHIPGILHISLYNHPRLKCYTKEIFKIALKPVKQRRIFVNTDKATRIGGK